MSREGSFLRNKESLTGAHRVQVHQTVLEWMKQHGALPSESPATGGAPAEDTVEHDIDFWGDDLR